MEEENRLVSECPPPPNYYKRFKTADDALRIKPPTIPSISSNLSSKQQYGSIITNNLPTTASYDPEKDYKAKLHEALDVVVAKSLELFKSASLPNISYEVKFVELNASIMTFNQLLNEFREHEAHYKLCNIAEKRLKEINELRDKMKSLLPPP